MMCVCMYVCMYVCDNDYDYILIHYTLFRFYLHHHYTIPDAPTSKITSTKNYGADVVFYDRYSESREDIGDRIISNAGGDGGGVLLVKPYDNYDVINGQGTTG